MNSEKPKPAERGTPAKDDPRAGVTQPKVEKRTEVPGILLEGTGDSQSEGQTPRGRNERLLTTIADLLGVPESSLLPGAEPFGPGSQLGELSELVQTFLTIEDPGERHRILEIVRHAARTKSRT